MSPTHFFLKKIDIYQQNLMLSRVFDLIFFFEIFNTAFQLSFSTQLTLIAIWHI